MARKLSADDYRFAIMALQERELEWESLGDALWPDQIPSSGTLSGWMRTQREAREYVQGNAVIKSKQKGRIQLQPIPKVMTPVSPLEELNSDKWKRVIENMAPDKWHILMKL